MIQNYQIDLILDNKLSETQVDSNLKEILDFIKINLSTDDISIEKEGLKRLAYPIKKNWNGYYVTLELDLDSENTRNIKKLENKLNLSNFVGSLSEVKTVLPSPLLIISAASTYGELLPQVLVSTGSPFVYSSNICFDCSADISDLMFFSG